MVKLSKRVKDVKSKKEDKLHTLEEAVALVKEFPKAKFDESVELNFQLGIDPKKPDQLVRGSVLLPNGTGKSVRIVVFAKGEEVRDAEAAGADVVGDTDLADKIMKGWDEFDVVVAHPEMMRDISKLGKVLGPRGLMPSPKVGTVTKELGKAVKDIKKGRIEFKSDKTCGVHVAVGKLSFETNQIVENIRTVIKTVIEAKPQSSKGTYLKSIAVSSTMGAGYKIDPSPLA